MSKCVYVTGSNKTDAVYSQAMAKAMADAGKTGKTVPVFRRCGDKKERVGKCMAEGCIEQQDLGGVSEVGAFLYDFLSSPLGMLGALGLGAYIVSRGKKKT